MKFKKRKKLIHVLIPRMIVAWVLAGILAVCGIMGFYYYVADVFVRYTKDADTVAINNNHIRSLIKDGKLETNPGMIKIYMTNHADMFELMGFPYSFASLNEKQYAEIYDLEKEKAVIDSSAFFYLLVLTYEDERPKDKLVYDLNIDALSEIPEFAQICEDFEKRDRSWDEFTGKKEWMRYDIKTTDIYVNPADHSFYPGKVQITKWVMKNRLGEYGLISSYYHPETTTIDCSGYYKDRIRGCEHVILYDGDFDDINPQEIPDPGRNISNLIRYIDVMGTTKAEKEYIKSVWEEREYFKGNGDYMAATVPGPFEHKDMAVIGKFNFGGEYSNLEYRYMAAIPDVAATFRPVYGIIAVFFFVLLTLIALLVSLVKYKNLLYFYRNEDFRKTLMNSMAHDLKTPLAAMSGYAQNLKENVGTDKREHYAEEIEKSAGYMNGIIADILALSRLEDNMAHPKKQRVDLAGLMNEISEQYKDRLEEKKLTFTMEMEGSYKKYADPLLMKRALENLFTNALKYTEEGGEIKVTVSNIPFRSRFILENSPAQEIDCKPEKLWEPFVKGQKSRSDQNGTGVGLSIAKNIFNLHHVKAKIREKDGVFRVILK